MAYPHGGVMANYQATLICPLCYHQRRLTHEDACELVAQSIKYRDISVSCKSCAWSFSSKLNLVFKEEQCHALSAKTKYDTRESVPVSDSV
jgi:hypothetical protein